MSKSICFEKKIYRDCLTLSMFLHRFVKILIHHTSGKNTYRLPSFFLRNTSNTLRVRRLMDYSFYNHLSRCLVKHAWYNVKFHIFAKNASTGVYISGPTCLYTYTKKTTCGDLGTHKNNQKPTLQWKKPWFVSGIEGTIYTTEVIWEFIS